MKSKGTPGKWEVYGDFKKGYWVVDDRGKRICEILPIKNDGIETIEANAKLIAQSPMMYEEIKALVDSLSDPDIADMEIPLGVVLPIMKLKERIKEIEGE